MPKRPVPISNNDPGSGVGESAPGSPLPSEGGPPGSPPGSIEAVVVAGAGGEKTPGTSEIAEGTAEIPAAGADGNVDATEEAGGALGIVGAADGAGGGVTADGTLADGSEATLEPAEDE